MKSSLVTICTLIFLIMNVNSYSQIHVKGKVIDIDGVSIPGVTVLEKGSTNGVATDIEGDFQIQLVKEGFIEISFVGFTTQNIQVTTSTNNLVITLLNDAQTLSEVVVMGYGTQRKKDLTGAVSIMQLDDLKTTPVASVDQMMQGKLSGVNVIPDNMPGGGVAIRVRGFSTIRNNDPLYIIDGMPVEGGISFLNPNDIASMQVLKDASSASIYGARAANGVVIISTKKGKDGLHVNFDAYVGVQSSAKQIRQLSATEFGDLLWIAQANDGKIPNSGIYGNGKTPVIPEFIDAAKRTPSADVDWVDEVMQSGLVQSYNVSLSKADQLSSQLASISYFNQEGVIKYTGYQRVSGRLNSEYNLLDKRLKLGQNLSLSHSWGTTVSNNSALGGLLYDAYKTISITPIYDLDGNFASNPIADIQNPLGNLYRNKDNSRRTSRAFGNVFAELEILPNFYFKTNIGMDYKLNHSRIFNPAYKETNQQRPISALNTNNEWYYNWTFSNTLNYSNTIAEKHQLSVLLGTESLKNQTEGFSASRDGFVSDDENFRYLDAGNGSTQKNSGRGVSNKILSFFGKIDYSFDDRYLASLTLRRDGTSKLRNHKWGNFPAVSAGWRISNEKFFNIPLISDLKFRIGWGQNGNSDIPAYSTVNSYYSNLNHSNYPIGGSQNSVVTGYTQTRIGNPNLKWETTTQTNIGVDLSLMSNLISLSVDWFNKNTKDLLWQRPLSGVVGGTNQSVWDNVGSMNNKGIEAAINFKKSYASNWGFDLGFNVSYIKNKLTELNNDVAYIGLPSGSIHSINFGQEISRSAAGQSIGSFYVYQEDGLFKSKDDVLKHVNAKGELLQPNAQGGDIRFVDVDGNGKIDANDRSYVGNPLPDWTAGLNLGTHYKGFDLSLFFQGVFGNDVYDLTRYTGDFFNQSQYNKNNRTLNAWSVNHTNAQIPRLSQDDPNHNIRPSTYFIQNGSFIRLKSAKIGYRFDHSKLAKWRVSNLYIYLQASNLLTLSGYDGMDPEVGLQNYGGDYRNLDMGIDRGIYPLSRTFTLGLNVTF